MSRKILSLDIQDNGIAAILVENSLKGNQIAAQQFVPYPVSDPDSGHEAEGPADPFLDALKKCVEDVSVPGLEVIVSVPPQLVSYRNLQVPFKDPKKIRQVLLFGSGEDRITSDSSASLRLILQMREMKSAFPSKMPSRFFCTSISRNTIRV